MELRPLGGTGIDVSPLGLGTVKIGRDQRVKYPSAFTIPNDDAVRELFDLAWELGVNVVDTAPAYGNSEERLGRLLPHKNDWIVVSKTGESFENGESRFDFSAKFTRKSVERSLRLLGRDYIDILLVHSDGNDMNIIRESAVCDTLQQLKQEGLIRAVGMSTKTVESGLWCLENMDVVMVTYNAAHTDELPVLKRAAELKKGVLIKKGLQSGHAQSISDALQFVFAQPSAHSVIVGTIDPVHLRDNVAVTENVLATC
ncbi:NADP-dependent oxidoreductase domain protein [Mycolicibacterium rhodesiae JS60]|nr:NADP-dependent oxidoreductase domain protein [Mycolicibacterium rhodesiae JS60]